jgi:hypothetical protein
MFIVNYLRFNMTKVMNSKSDPLFEDASISFKNLRGTMLEHKADSNKQASDEQEVDLNNCLLKIKPEKKHAMAIARSQKMRKNCNYLPENSVKQRKAYFCTKESGYLEQKYKFNQMQMLQDPDMMGNMIKGNVQSVFNIGLFSGIGSIFSGFIIAQFPFPLGHKFKSMTQQGIRLVNLDPSFVSSMSW